MSGNSLECRLNAARCLRLADRASRPQARENFTAMAETWTSLAAQLECDQTLLSTLAELDFSEPYEAMPLALKLRSWSATLFVGRSPNRDSEANRPPAIDLKPLISGKS
jgi:hypothetical protein